MKNILITGASRGIGRAAAIEFAKLSEPYRFFIAALKNSEALEDTARIIRSHGRECTCFCGDVSDYGFCEHMTAHINKNSDGIDILINNAGISYVGLLQDMSIEDWNRVINTNLTSVFSLSSLVIPGMLKKKSGKIINISSIWGSSGASCETAYSASKGAVNSFTKALAKELAPSGIQVNAAAFGVIDTDMNNFLSSVELCDLCDSIPVGRPGTVSEAAGLIVLLSKAPEYLTGQIITMDGGM